MRTLKIKITVVLFMVAALIVGNFPVIQLDYSVTAQAASRNANAIKAYKEFLESSKQYWGGNEYSTSAFTFTVIDLNKDGVKELIVANSAAYTADSYERVFTYYDDEMKEMLSCFSGGIDKIYPDKQIVVVSGAHTGDYWTYYYKMTNDVAAKVATIHGQDYLKGHEGTVVNKYYLNGTKTTKATFDKNIKKITGTKSKTIKAYKNTSSNRSKYLK